MTGNGAVYQKNKAALNLLSLPVLTHLRQLEKVSPQLMDMLWTAAPGDKLQTEISNEREVIHLSLRVSGIKIKNEELRIVALSNINKELDEREIDAWMRLCLEDLVDQCVHLMVSISLVFHKYSALCFLFCSQSCCHGNSWI